MLCSGYFCQTGERAPVLKAMEKWLSGKGIKLIQTVVVSSILKFYGKDYTFSVPILSMLTLCGVLPSSSLEKIPGLPFELTLLPASFYSFLNLRVVSYALPALIGVGIYPSQEQQKGYSEERSDQEIRSLSQQLRNWMDWYLKAADFWRPYP